jgi:hypothetical protein
MSDKNSSLPKSGQPERWIVLAIAVTLNGRRCITFVFKKVQKKFS